MSFKTFKLILKDNTVLTGYINGTNFVLKGKADESIFTQDNLSIVKIQVEDQPEVEYSELIFIQQMFFEGEYYLAFRQKTKDEKREERIAQLEKENAELQQRCLETEDALIELAGMQEV